MTEPRSVGSVSVTVVPDARGFPEKLREDTVPFADVIGREIGRALGSAMVDDAGHSFDELRLKLVELGRQQVDIKVNLDDRGGIAATEAKLTALDSTAGNVGGSGGGLSAMGGQMFAIGQLAVTAADIAIPALLAIGAAAGGIVAGLGVFALGFSGIGEALQAANSKPAGGGGANRVAGAGLSQQSQQISAAQATQSAQDQLTQAERNQVDAEKALHDARVQAVQDLLDLDNKLKDNALNQQQAAITLTEARKTLARELASPGANLPQYADQIAQARLNVDLAVQKQKELAQQGTQLGGQDTSAHKAGVDGAQAVIDAREKLVEANHKLAEAQANVTITAEKNAIAAQQSALSMQSAAAGADSFGAAMAKLNPLQQQFVDFLLSLKPLFEELKTAASLFLPGLEQGIKNALPAFGPLLGVVGNVANAMGDVFTEIGKSLGSGDGQKFLKFLSTELPGQIHFLGGLFIDFGKIFANVWQAAGPLITATDKAITEFFDAIAKSSGGKGLKDFFDGLIPLVHPFEQFLEHAGKLLGDLLKAVQPAIPPTIHLFDVLAQTLDKLASGGALKEFEKLWGDLLTAITPLLPPLGDLINTLFPPFVTLADELVKALSPIVPLIAQGISEALKDLAPHMPAISKAFAELAESVGKLLTAVAPLIPLLVRIITDALFVAIIGPATILAEIWSKLADVAAAVLGPAIRGIMHVFHDLGDVVPGIFNDVKQAIADAFTWIKEKFDTVTAPLKAAWSAIWDGLSTAFSTIWTGLKEEFKGFVNIIIEGINFLIRALDDLHIHIPKVHIPGTSVDFGGGDIGFDISQIPELRQFGGPVTAGKPYIAGEVGPELFIPNVDATILDHTTSSNLLSKLANNVNKTQNFYINGQPTRSRSRTRSRSGRRR